ncbi:hypothetical protein V1286_002744 [Bradyrhizobium algeriense]|uniref:Uncharacterized protein n=1 Tax=Bradyrhizobium algeriense TaxID=634784 RepID=A0ABU8B9Q4_9BRAD
MGNGNIDVGSATPTRKPGQPVERQGKNSEGKTSEHPVSLCGAMSQQGGEFRGNVSAPQKLVQLVGCRDRKAGPGPGARQYSNPVKR